MQAPTMVPMASDSSAPFMLGILPSLSTMEARVAVPTRVPMVSNISMTQKVTTSVITVNQPISRKPAKLNRKKVVLNISPKGGAKDAVARAAKGLVPKNRKEPAQ